MNPIHVVLACFRSILINIQMSAMKRPDFLDVLEICNFFSVVKDLLLTTGVQIRAYSFRLPHGPMLRRTNGVQVEVY
jgi:hypothetical protein